MINADDELLGKAWSILRTVGEPETVDPVLREAVDRETRQAWLDWWASDPLPDLRDRELMQAAWR